MSEKTEQPTPKKLRDARKKGQVAKSKEIASAAGITGLFLVIWIGSDFFMEHFKEMILLPSRYYEIGFSEALKQVMGGVFIEYLLLSLPIVSIAMILGIAANYFQIGALFAPESVKPDLKKLDPVQGMKKIFSMNNLIELIKSVVKITFLGILIYIVIKESVHSLVRIPYLGISGLLMVLGGILKNMVIYTSIAYIVVAAADYFLQKKQHVKKLMMSKDEVKREYKEMEGDPVVKGQRKQLHREMAMNDAAQKTRGASVLVTNPTRLAVALYYEKDKTPLPLVVCKGEDLLARRMIEVAKEEGIPIMQNVPLARDLYEHSEVDQFIPTELIESVAEVLRWVRDLQQDTEPTP